MNSDPTVQPSQGGKGGNCCEKTKLMAQQYNDYDKLLITDSVLMGIHLIAFLILKVNWFMMVTLWLIRVPRLVLHCFAKRDTREGYEREYLFRKWSCILYFPLAFTFQILAMLFNFCNTTTGVLVTNRNKCYGSYAATICVLLILYMFIDLSQFWKVKKFCESKIAARGGSSAATTNVNKQFEMPANNMV